MQSLLQGRIDYDNPMGVQTGPCGESPNDVMAINSGVAFRSRAPQVGRMVAVI